MARPCASLRGIPAGTYAVTVLHDENSDGKMDFNWIGMPTKGYGFSIDIIYRKLVQ
jgi:uncharacterized protein (DUF2141 family)